MGISSCIRNIDEVIGPGSSSQGQFAVGNSGTGPGLEFNRSAQKQASIAVKRPSSRNDEHDWHPGDARWDVAVYDIAPKGGKTLHSDSQRLPSLQTGVAALSRNLYPNCGEKSPKTRSIEEAAYKTIISVHRENSYRR
jgi:hypothetical protein